MGRRWGRGVGRRWGILSGHFPLLVSEKDLSKSLQHTNTSRVKLHMFQRLPPRSPGKHAGGLLASGLAMPCSLNHHDHQSQGRREN